MTTWLIAPEEMNPAERDQYEHERQLDIEAAADAAIATKPSLVPSWHRGYADWLKWSGLVGNVENDELYYAAIRAYLATKRSTERAAGRTNCEEETGGPGVIAEMTGWLIVELRNGQAADQLRERLQRIYGPLRKQIHTAMLSARKKLELEQLEGCC